MVKVSIVIPTWRSNPQHLDRLVRSIDSQTMDSANLEMVFVDDGSDDDTMTLLYGIRDAHPGTIVDCIEHSGWPSAPRNRGIELATGEYLFFADQDDEFTPEGLSAAYDMAKRNNSDVVSVKEVRDTVISWGLDTWIDDVEQVASGKRAAALGPMNPHKLYRRELIMDRGIRFLENLDPMRMITHEGPIFDLDVLSASPVVSKLSSVVVYRWLNEQAKNVVPPAIKHNQWGPSIRLLLKTINDKLNGDELEGERRSQLIHHYLHRVLRSHRLTSTEDEEQRELHDLVENLIPAAWDVDLPGPWRVRSKLIRAHKWDLLHELIDTEPAVEGISKTQEVFWDDGELVVRESTRWHDKDGQRWPMRRAGNGIALALPAEIEQVVGEETLDVTSEVAQVRAQMVIRSRESFATWFVPSKQELRAEERNGMADIQVLSTIRLNPETVVFGRKLDDPIWDAYGRNELFGVVNQRRVRTGITSRVALRAGRIVSADAGRDGTMILTIGQENKSLIESAPLQVTLARSDWNKQTKMIDFAIPLSGVSVFDGTVLEAEVNFGNQLTCLARVEQVSDQVVLHGSVLLEKGKYPVTVRVEGIENTSGLTAIVSSRGKSLEFIHGV